MSYSNTLFIGFALGFSSLLLQCHEIQGKEWLVGDQKGWSPGISNRPNGKNFTPGDVLGKILFSLSYIYIYTHTHTTIDIYAY